MENHWDIQDSELNFYVKKNKLDKRDKELLKSIEPIVTAVSRVFGRNCEVILHSLEDPSHSVIKIENQHITKRKVGSPLTDLAIKTLMKASETKEDVIGSYYTRTEDDKLFKSITALIKNSDGFPVGMFCINIDISADFSEFIKDFIPNNITTSNNTTSEHFVSDINDLVDKALEKSMNEIVRKKGLSNRERNYQIISKLLNKNIFDIKGSIETVAEHLGMSKYTIYSYLRKIKENNLEDEK